MKWVDANKGDKKNPEHRRRLVAQEIKKDRGEDLFAATPPLEAKKMLLSLWASGKRAGDEFGLRRRGSRLLPHEGQEKGVCGVVS